MEKNYDLILFKIELPWPPSVNNYWRHTKKGHYISEKGREFREIVHCLSVKHKGKFSEDCRLSVNIEAFPPDRRKRDLDNILKSLLDSLQYGGIYHDDSQIDRLCITRNFPLSGHVLVTIYKIDS